MMGESGIDSFSIEVMIKCMVGCTEHGKFLWALFSRSFANQ